MNFREVVNKARGLYADRCRQGRASITYPVVKKAAFHLGISESTFLGVVDLLK
jgi:hypothetical protein